MIYYFSGTGNSLAVAQSIAAETGQKISNRPIATPEGSTDEVAGFVCPVYAWGIPRHFKEMIREWVRMISTKEIAKPKYIFMVLTCGDDIGMTDREMSRLLKEGGHNLDACFSIAMPNTYVCLPGFDIDPADLQQHKLQTAKGRIREIIGHINQRKRGLTDVVRGTVPRLKSYVLRPLFNSFLTGDKHFLATNECIGCGLCQRICPLQNITSSSAGKPQWNGNCADCLRCYHLCPKHAIHYAGRTHTKGQYHHMVLDEKPRSTAR